MLRNDRSSFFCFCFFLFFFTSVVFGVIPPKVDVPPFQINEEALKHSFSEERLYRIGCWNIRWFPGYVPKRKTDKKIREQKKDVARIIREIDPDFFFACEIESLEAIQSLGLEYAAIACTDIPRLKSENDQLPQQGIAFLSKMKWKEIWVLDFSELADLPDRPSRGILGVEFEFPNRQRLILYGVHLKSNRGSYQSNQMRRERAIDYLRWDWKRKGFDPQKDQILVLGDFNTSLHNPVFREEKTLSNLLNEGFRLASEGVSYQDRVTLLPDPAGRYPGGDFDHILFSLPFERKLVRRSKWQRRVKVDYGVSDHCPIYIEAFF